MASGILIGCLRLKTTYPPTNPNSIQAQLNLSPTFLLTLNLHSLMGREVVFSGVCMCVWGGSEAIDEGSEKEQRFNWHPLSYVQDNYGQQL